MHGAPRFFCILAIAMTLPPILNTAYAQSSTGTGMGPRRVPILQNSTIETQAARIPQPTGKEPAYDASWKTMKQPVRFNLGTGYRKENLDWNIASNTTGTTTPNILSELKWNNIRSYQISGKGEIIVPEGYLRGLYMNASGYRGWITDGRNQDSDYLGNNRTEEFSRSNNKASNGSTIGGSAALGYAFDWENIEPVQLLRLIGMAGYAYDEQKLQMTGGNQTLTGCGFLGPDYICGIPLGPFAGLDSRYNARWSGPFLGLDLSGHFAQRHFLRMRGQYHWASYHGEANWNLRSNFLHPRSFEHQADGTGYVLALMYGFSLTHSLDLSLEGQYERFSTDPGVDYTYSLFGQGVTRLNEVNWDATTFRAGLDYRF